MYFTIAQKRAQHWAQQPTPRQTPDPFATDKNEDIKMSTEQPHNTPDENAAPAPQPEAPQAEAPQPEAPQAAAPQPQAPQAQAPQAQAPQYGQPANYQTSTAKRLVRRKDDRMLGGVCSGVAAYLNVDVTLVRVLVAVGTLIGFGSLAIAYLVAWALLPEE